MDFNVYMTNLNYNLMQLDKARQPTKMLNTFTKLKLKFS